MGIDWGRGANMSNARETYCTDSRLCSFGRSRRSNASSTVYPFGFVASTTIEATLFLLRHAWSDYYSGVPAHNLQGQRRACQWQHTVRRRPHMLSAYSVERTPQQRSLLCLFLETRDHHSRRRATAVRVQNCVQQFVCARKFTFFIFIKFLILGSLGSLTDLICGLTWGLRIRPQNISMHAFG